MQSTFDFTQKSKLLFLLFFIVTILSAQNHVQLDFLQKKQNTNTALMTVSMVNDSNKTIKVLKWNTPFEKTINADIFNIYDGKTTVQYIGRLVKRSHPTESDYIILKAGKKRTTTINIAKYYRMEKKGEYLVSYKGAIKALTSKGQSDILSKTGIPSLRISYTPSATQKKSSQSTGSTAKLDPTFTSCTQSQIDILNAAHDKAIVIAEESANTMNAVAANTVAERYYTWFGVPDNNRQSTVTTHFNNIYSALDTENISFDCTCNESYYAYVYPSQPYVIYLCNAFWTASATGTDSQAGTLVHETSHFTVVAGTDDYAYGKTDCRALAVNNPNNAVFNADTHEYFAENTPFLSMVDKFATATPIADILGDLPISSTIATSGEKNMYVFTAGQTALYTLYTTGALDSYGRLYDAGFQQLTEDDDSGTSYNFQLVYSLQDGETYYLEVSAYGTNSGDYTLNSDIYPNDGPLGDWDGDGILNNIDPDDSDGPALTEEQRYHTQGANNIDNRIPGKRVQNPQVYPESSCGQGTPCVQGTIILNSNAEIDTESPNFLTERPMCNTESEYWKQGTNGCISIE